MKDKDDREEDFRAVFSSILARINEKRSKKDKVLILERELAGAVENYCEEYQDEVMFR